MTPHGPEKIVFERLGEIDPAAIIELMNNPGVRRHLPLARGHFGPAECERFVAAKERMWEDHGFGPWGIVIDGEFAGWGGLQPEGDDADVGLVLHPDFWGLGRVLFEGFIRHAFDELGLSSVIALLPPSRKRVGGMLRLGFRRDGEAIVRNERFIRYRLRSADGGGEKRQYN